MEMVLVEVMYLVNHLKRTGEIDPSVFSASDIASSSAGTEFTTSAQLMAIQLPDTTKKIDIIDRREIGVTLTFKPKTNLGMRLTEHDSEKLLRELFQIVHNHPAPFNKTEWVRNALGNPIAMIFSAAGIKLATTQFEYNFLRGVTSFSITLHRQIVTKRSFSAFKEDVRIAMYKACIENDYNFIGFDIKRDVVASNAKKLNKLSESFTGNKPQWQVHKDNVNARFTLFPPKASQADALETHLKAGGLTLFKRGQMTQSKREIVSVDLALRDSTAPAAASSNTP